MTDLHRTTPNPSLIILSGHNASGKSFLIRKLVDKLRLSVIRPDSIRDHLINEVSFFRDADYSYPSEKAVAMRTIVAAYRNQARSACQASPGTPHAIRSMKWSLLLGKINILSEKN